MFAFLTLLATLTGWFVSARFSEKAQERLFLHDIINAARLDLAEQIRVEQTWISDLYGLGFKFRLALDSARLSPTPPTPLQAPLAAQREQLEWLNHNASARASLYRNQGPGRMLTMRLEEYELLFPETRHVRMQLNCRRRDIVNLYTRLVGDIMYPARREAAVAAIEARVSEDMDYSAVLQDLLGHIQSASLGRITGGSIPPRAPQDPNLPLMVMREDGQLHIVERGTPWPIMESPPTQEARHGQWREEPSPGDAGMRD